MKSDPAPHPSARCDSVDLKDVLDVQRHAYNSARTRREQARAATTSAAEHERFNAEADVFQFFAVVLGSLTRVDLNRA